MIKNSFAKIDLVQIKIKDEAKEGLAMYELNVQNNLLFYDLSLISSNYPIFVIRRSK